MLRFVERRPRTDADGPGTARATYKVLPGLTEVAADFDGTTSSGCFADHWVSNVVDRGGFMATLEDCLGFTPKVSQTLAPNSSVNKPEPLTLAQSQTLAPNSSANENPSP